MLWTREQVPPPPLWAREQARRGHAGTRARYGVLEAWLRPQAMANKAAVFVVRPGSLAKDAAAAPGEDPKKRSSGSQEPAAPKQLPVVLVPSAPVRTSSCTKEEVDAILI